MNTPLVLDVTAATFEAEVVEASKQVPIIVDFWAPWCGPCRALGPMLEKLAHEYGGRFRLAKVNSDENIELSQAFNVRSIPDVRAFRDGHEIDRFMGALPERQVRDFIEGVAPSAAEAARLRADGMRRAGDLAAATDALREALRLDPAHELARIELAELLCETAEHDEAAQLLDSVRPSLDWDARVDALRQAIAFARAGGDERALSAQVAANPSDLEARLALAGAFAARKAWREAMDALLEIVRRDKSWRDGEARRQMLAIFNLIAGEADLVSEYRRKLASVLH